MPWDTREVDGRYCVYKEGENEPLKCYDNKADADKYRAALYANESSASKAANLYDWIISRIHMQFTCMADDLYGNGQLTQEERITLSAAIGKALDAYNQFAKENLAQLYERRPYEEIPNDAPLNGDMPMMAKAGARHSSRDQRMLQDIHDHAASLGAMCGEKEGASGKSADMPAQPADGAIKSIPYPIKALGGDRLGGYLVLWGNPEQKDLTGEYFTPETEELTAIYKAMGKLPFLYEHAMDGALKAAVVGVIDLVKEDEIGLWYETQLDRAGRYKQAIQKLAQEGALGTSSGTLPGARKVSADGRILRWAICEGSATTTPAEPRMVDCPLAEIKSHFVSIGLTFPEMEGEGTEEVRPEITAKLRLLDLMALETV